MLAEGFYTSPTCSSYNDAQENIEFILILILSYDYIFKKIH